MRTYEIRLDGCAFFARHGVMAEEAALGQRFYVDVRLVVEDAGALDSDEIEGTVHYGHVFEAIERVVTATRRNLIETLANDIGRAVLDGWPQVSRATITVRKPSAPVPGVLDSVSATVACER